MIDADEMMIWLRSAREDLVRGTVAHIFIVIYMKREAKR